MDASLSIRLATVEDRAALWDWYGEPLHRLAFRKTRVEDAERHTAWWSRLTADPDVTLCIGSMDIIRVGCVRFDRADDGAFEMCAYLKPAYCRLGLMPTLLDAAMDFVAKRTGGCEFRMRLQRAHPRIDAVLPRGAGDELRADGDGALIYRRARPRPSA